MSYYENVYPELDEVVCCQLSEFSDHGVYFILNEYENKKGFLPDTEMTKKIYYEKKKYFNYVKFYPLVVTNIDFNKGNIDLSHSKIKNDERDKYIKYFEYTMNIYRLTEEFSRLSQIPVNSILPLTMWKYITKNDIENSQKKFKSLLEKPGDFVTHAKDKYPDEADLFVNSLSSRITSTKMVFHKYIELTFYCDNPLDEIKQVLNFDNYDNIKIEYVNAPVYRIIAECSIDISDPRSDIIYKCMMENKERENNYLVKVTNKINIDIFDDIINVIKSRINDKKINFVDSDLYLAKDKEISVKYLPKNKN